MLDQQCDIGQLIDPGMLAPPVRDALNSPGATITEWDVEAIAYGSVSTQTRQLYRAHGTVRDGAATQPWSLALKMYTPPLEGKTHSVTHPLYWKREPEAYASGLLRTLPPTFRAARCHGITERSDGSVWLWLEDLRDTDAPWVFDQYVVAARHLGHLAAPYLLGRSLPTASWLTRHYDRFATSEVASLLAAARDPLAWQHPLLHAFTPDLVGAMLELWERTPSLLTRMERVPQTLCHHDVWRNNLFACTRTAGLQQTVAIDWELIGVGAAGEDAGNLLFVSLLNMDQEMADAPALAAAMQQAYVEGLHDHGWRDDTESISFAFRAAALRCIFSTITWPVAIVQDQTGRLANETEQRWQRPLAAVFMSWAALAQFVLAQLARDVAVS